MGKYQSDSTSKIHLSAQIGDKTIIEEYTIIGENVKIGEECKIHRNINIGDDVIIGNRVKIQDYVMIPKGVTLKDGVFIGPGVAFTNDLYPRSITPEGTLATGDDWTLVETVVEKGASIGANATIVCGITIGPWAMVGAGAVVTKDVPANTLVVGNPAKEIRKIKI